MNLGFMIKITRESFGFTQRELAEKSGLTTAAICQIERGLRSPNIKTILKLQKAFDGVSLDYLIGGEYRNNCAKCASVKYRISELIRDI